MTSSRLRPAVRALVLDHDDHLLLARLVFPHGAWWVLPGGGIAPGEERTGALRRELAEETGLVGVEIGAQVWERTHWFDLVDGDGTRWAGQRETVHLVRTARFTPEPAMSEAELRAENLHELRWWTVDEIAAHDGPDHFAPRDLAVHARAVIEHGPPAVPFVIEQRE